MKCLALSRSSAYAGRRRIREVCFEDRSSLPASAACVVASGARETLGALLASPVSLRLFEPVLPSPDAWRAILDGATLYRYRGTVADAAIVLRPRDALALARAAFGEVGGEETTSDAPLSPLESDVLARVSAAVGASLAAVCGLREGAAVERVAEIGAYTTFFELLLDRPVRASIGVAVSRDPARSRAARWTWRISSWSSCRLRLFGPRDVSGVRRDGTAARQSAAGCPGAVAREARAGGRTLAYGNCGVRHGWYALAVEGKGIAI